MGAVSENLLKNGLTRRICVARGIQRGRVVVGWTKEGNLYGFSNDFDSHVYSTVIVRRWLTRGFRRSRRRTDRNVLPAEFRPSIRRCGLFPPHQCTTPAALRRTKWKH